MNRGGAKTRALDENAKKRSHLSPARGPHGRLRGGRRRGDLGTILMKEAVDFSYWNFSYWNRHEGEHGTILLNGGPDGFQR